MEDFLIEQFACFGIAVFAAILFLLLLYIFDWFYRVNDMLIEFEKKIKNKKNKNKTN